MTAQNCLQMLREIKDVAFATVDENGRPQNRIIDIMLIEEHALIFCTARGKDFYKQLTENGYVAVTGLTKNYQMIRFSGKVRKLSEQKLWIDRIFEENPSMNDVYPKDSRYILEPFILDNGQLEFFDLSSRPIERQTFSIGEETRQKGFFITEKCIGCQKCARNCPQQCIVPGKPYVIEQNHCLHCGYCAQNCPIQAIQRRGENRCSGK